MNDILDIFHTFGPLLLIGQYPEGPLGGLALTLLLAVAGLVLSFPLSVLMGMARTAPAPWLPRVSGWFVHLVRGIPMLMLIFWAYYAVPLLVGGSVSGTTTMVCALVVYETAFLGEVVAGGIRAIPRGQAEAARSLGLGYLGTMRDVVLPQALYNVIPSIVSQFINLIKNTSLAYVIDVNELTHAAYGVNAQLLTQPFEVFMILAGIYFVVCFLLARLTGLIERRIGRSRTTRSQTGAMIGQTA